MWLQENRLPEFLLCFCHFRRAIAWSNLSEMIYLIHLIQIYYDVRASKRFDKRLETDRLIAVEKYIVKLRNNQHWNKDNGHASLWYRRRIHYQKSGIGISWDVLSSSGVLKWKQKYSNNAIIIPFSPERRKKVGGKDWFNFEIISEIPFLLSPVGVKVFPGNVGFLTWGKKPAAEEYQLFFHGPLKR